MTEWFENTEIWCDISPLIFHETNWENTKADVDRGIALLKLLPGATVPDIPCGPGRHALEFGRRGFRVTAVDLMPFFLEQGSRRAQKEQLDIEFIQDDMRVFRRPESFDAVWHFFSSFGYFQDPKDDEDFLRNSYQNLVPGGKLLLEMSSRDHAVEFWKNRDRFEHPPVNDCTLIEEGRLSDDESTVHLHWHIIKGDQVNEHRFSLRLYSENQMAAVLENAGFLALAVHADMLGNTYTPESERMVVVADK